ncbi:MAG: acyl-CoA dehydrogenase [Alphaproteobacteria bacterium]|nr:MAG: acyl-CoA dehydrogenase [Alphaproteobacteria bacterium]
MSQPTHSDVPDDPAAWQAWIGRTQEAADTIDAGRAQALQATLDDSGPPLEAGAPLPPLWHWLYFWWVAPSAALGPDGHPARGGFLPPIEGLPRRMWAGSRVRFLRPLPVGAAAMRRSTVADIRVKQGRSGRLAFVTVRHEIVHEAQTCLIDEHDIVYRPPPRPGETPRPGEPAPAEAPWRRDVKPDPVLLFRYSALTFNGHRIHYDRPYAVEVEGYPGLVVHGPLLATLMIELVRTARPGTRVAGFTFRALRPVFDTAPFTVAGRPDAEGADLWVTGADGFVAMRGRAAFA